MLTKGLIIMVIGIIGLLGVIIWTIIDIKNKDRKEQKLLDQAITNTHKNYDENNYEQYSLANSEDTLWSYEETDIIENNDTTLMEDETDILA